MNPAFDPSQLPLRDNHLPPPVDWWPLAPGWWILAGGLILLLVLWIASRGWRAALRTRRLALRELRELQRQQRRQPDSARHLRALSVLLRRIALTCHPREKVAGLSGEAWLEFLDQQLPARAGQPFREGVGRALLEAPYHPAATLDTAALDQLVARWIRAAARCPQRGQRKP